MLMRFIGVSPLMQVGFKMPLMGKLLGEIWGSPTIKARQLFIAQR
jgi:hypothetical protein